MISDQLKPINLISHELKADGFSVITRLEHGFGHLASLARRFDEHLTKTPYTPYRPTLFKEYDLHEAPNSDLSHYNDFCLGLINGIGAKEKHLDATFKTIDTPDSKHIAQDPHFDRIPTLKFMLYVNDLSFAKGAFVYHLEAIYGQERILDRVTRGIPMELPAFLKRAATFQARY